MEELFAEEATWECLNCGFRKTEIVANVANISPLQDCPSCKDKIWLINREKIKENKNV